MARPNLVWHVRLENRGLVVYLDKVVHSSDHLRAEHERLEQLDLTANLALHDGPHLQNRMRSSSFVSL